MKKQINIYKQAEINATDAFNETIRESMGVSIFKANRSAGYIVIDKYVVNEIRVDQYNNLDCNIPKSIPIDYLPKFGEVLLNIFENDSYKGRSHIGFYINYFRQHHKSLSLEDIQIMYRHPKYRDDGFKEWLVGTSYSSSGNIPYNCKYTREQLSNIYTQKEIKETAEIKFGV